ISEDNYYTKSTEFRLWLHRSKKKYFEEMTADGTCRTRFAKNIAKEDQNQVDSIGDSIDA
ncbi:hypothetical protein BGZ52_008485, partial [Haplosporangium bisporale]